MGPIVAFLAKRLLLLIPILIGASIVVFVLVRLAPGDEATVLLGPLATPLARDELARHLGLDKPLPVQYWIWLWNSLHLDFGMSINKHQPVSDLVNAGMYAFHPSVLSEIDAMPPRDIGYDLLPRLVGRTRAMLVEAYFRDIGTADAYRLAREEWPVRAGP